MWEPRSISSMLRPRNAEERTPGATATRGHQPEDLAGLLLRARKWPNATRTPIGTRMFISPLLSRLFCGDVNVWRTSSHEGDVATFDRHERVGLGGTARRPLDRRSLEQGQSRVRSESLPLPLKGRELARESPRCSCE